MPKYAFIVDPFSSGALYADALVKRGITPVAILSHYPILDIYHGSFNKADFKHIYTLTGNINALISELEAFLEGDIPILVLPGTECGVELADTLSSHFCPQLSNGIELSSARRNKFDMSRQLLKSNIKLPLTIKSSSIDEVLNWTRAEKLLPVGVVIKPLSSAGTDGVTACFSEKEIADAIRKNIGKVNQMKIKNDYILAQEFIPGTEYVIDTVSISGIHIVTDICRYKKTKANGSNFVYEYLEFLPESGSVQQELSEYAFTVLDGLGIKNGPAHSEIMYSPDGPRLIETGIRPHGGIAIHGCRMATNNSQVDFAIDSVLANMSYLKNHIGYNLKNHTRIVFLISHHENTVVNESANLAKIRSLPSVTMVRVNIKPGETIKKTIDLFTMPGLLILSHNSLDQVEDDYNAIRRFEREGLFVLTGTSHRLSTIMA